MAERRAKLVSHARGSVLELGAGTGLNLSHYPDGLERLTLAEPESNMARRLEQRVQDLCRTAEVVRAPAEELPFDDRSFDTVVGTLVLCTVSEPARVLREIRRVLRPCGSFLFLEHVRSDSPRLARWQDRLHGAWFVLADGCNCNLETLGLIQGGGFDVSAPERTTWRRMPPLVHPLVSGRASPA